MSRAEVIIICVVVGFIAGLWVGKAQQPEPGVIRLAPPQSVTDFTEPECLI